jgi:hypothetical protein
MEKTVTLRFYEITRTFANKPSIEDVLRLIANKPIAEREARVGLEDVLVRLEDFNSRDGELFGQFVRGQSGNRPGRMLPEGTDNLPFGEPLGHGIAFRYRVEDGLLAIQFDSKILAPGRILEYLYAHEPRAEYKITPRLRPDAWQRFNELPIRKVEVSVAGHANANDLDNEDDPVWRNVAAIKDAYGADTVKFQISMGHRRGTLLDGAKSILREALRRFENGEDIRAMRGVLDPGEGIPNEEIDLMGTLFDVKEELSFDGDNFQRFYELRRDLLRVKIRLL